MVARHRLMETVMKNPNIAYVRALDCVKSPLNVRSRSDARADAELEANIGETGIVLQNLIGVAVPRQKGRYSIFGGGRRLEGVHNLIARGVLGDDFMVPVLLAGNARDAIEMSLAENYFNLPMNPADECRAFQAIIVREKKTPADVAKRFGKTERFVLGRLRLAGLAEQIFEALRLGEITLDVAAAYASTADTVLQASVFKDLSGYHYRSSVNEIRRRLMSGSYRGGDPKAVFVGRAAYQEAGGRIESDLFSDDATEIWIDGDILDRLGDAKLREEADALRERTGFAEVRPVPAGRPPFDETCRLDRLVGKPQPLKPEAEARKQAIESELASIDAAAADNDEHSEEQSQRIEALEEELGAILAAPAALSDEQRARAIAYLLIGPDGDVQMHEQLFVDPDQDDAGTVQEDAGPSPADDADVREDTVPAKYSQRLCDELAMMKTELIAVCVASEPRVALDLGTFFMVDAATRAVGAYDLPTDLRATKPQPRVAGFKSNTPATIAWSQLEEKLDRTWLVHTLMQDRYDAFCALADEARAAWLGWAIARTLQAVSAGSTGDIFLNHIGQKLAIDAAAWWRPTAQNFFDRISKGTILALLEEIGGDELKSRHGAARKFELAASCEALFAGQLEVEAAVQQRALAWLPEPMRFGSGNPHGPENPAPQTVDIEPLAEAEALDGDNDRLDLAA